MVGEYDLHRIGVWRLLDLKRHGLDVLGVYCNGIPHYDDQCFPDSV